MMKKKVSPFLFFTMVLLFQPLQAFADEVPFEGRLLEEGTGTPVPDATIVVLETDGMTVTGKDGEFILTVPEHGEYSVEAYAEGFEELKTVLTLPSAEGTVLRVKRVTVAMEDVQVTETRLHTQPTEIFTEKDIERTPNGGDPFQVVQRESDVVKFDAGTLDKDFGLARLKLAMALGFPQLAFTTPFSFRSLPDYSNAYFLEDYILLPFINYPSVSSVFSESVIPEALVRSLYLYGGGTEPSIGPGAGLMVSADMKDGVSDRPELMVRASFLRADVMFSLPLWKNTFLQASVRKSFYEYTWLQLLYLLDRSFHWNVFYNPYGNMLKLTLTPGNGDLYLHFGTAFGDDHTLDLELLGCMSYLYFGMDAINALNMKEGGDRITVILDGRNIVTAGGISWGWKPGNRLTNDLKLFDSLYSSSDNNGQRYFSGEQLDQVSTYPLNFAGVEDTVMFTLSDTVKLRTGASFRHIYGSYLHRVALSKPTFMTDREKELSGEALSAYEASVFTDVSFDIGAFRFIPSLRADWFSKAMGADFGPDDIRLSPLLTSVWFSGEKSELRLSLGMRTDRFDYRNWLLFNAAQGEAITDFWADGQTSTIDEKFLMKNPARLSAAQVSYRLDNSPFKLTLQSHFYFMDGMSGFDLQSYKATEDAATLVSGMGGYSLSLPTTGSSNSGFKAVDRMYSTGLTVKTSLLPDPFNLTINYSFGYSRIHLTETDAWVPPNTDIRNFMKIMFRLPVNRDWNLDLGLNIASGIPATPGRLTKYEKPSAANGYREVVEWIPVETEYNEFCDFMPRLTLNLQTEWKLGGGFTLFLDALNLLSFVHYAGPDPEKVQVGETEKSVFDRKYSVMAMTLDYLLNIRFDFGLRFAPE